MLRNMKSPVVRVRSLHMSDDVAQRLAAAEATVASQAKRLADMDRYFVTGTWGNTPTHSLKELCEVTHEACDILQPMIKAFYAKCNESYGTAKLKQDATFFSIADGIVQHLMVNYFLAGNKFHEIVGEEDDCDVNITTKPFTVDELVVPEEFESLVETTRNKIIQLAKKVDGESYKGITVFVDPIDGTREFATGKGDFCSVLVGYNNLIGQPVAGIMYRPLTNPPTWAAGAKSENVVMGRLDKAKKPNPKGVLVSDGVNTPFLLQTIEALGYEKVPCYASGNRALMLLEGKAGAYIRDTGGFAKWDCSGPQAVIEAYGGIMSKLPKFLKSKELESYTFTKSKINMDFESEQTLFTLSNAKDKRVARMVRDVLVTEVELVKEYACLQGLLALDKENAGKLDEFYEAMTKVAATTPPVYT